MLLGTKSRGLSTKTGSDHGVVVESPLLCCLLSELKAMTSDKAALFPFDQVAFRKDWWAGLLAVGVRESWPPLPKSVLVMADACPKCWQP